MNVSTVSGKQLSLKILLPNTGLPVWIENVEFLLFDKDMAEVLLERPLLNGTGLDLGKHLWILESRINCMSEAELRVDRAPV